VVLASCGNEDATSDDAGVAADDDTTPAPSATGPSPSGTAPDDAADDDAAPEPVADDDVAVDDDVPADDDVVADDDIVADDDVASDDDVAPDDDVPADDDMDAGPSADDDLADDDTMPPETDASTGGLGRCQVPDGATIVADYQLFNPDGGPNYGLVADGTTVYAAFVDRVVAIPQGGGAATEVYQSDYGVALYDYGADDAFLVRSGAGWFDLQAMAVTPAGFPEIDFPGLSMSFAVKDADTIWVRADDLYYRIASYAMLVRDEDAPRDVVAEVVEGTGGPLLVTPGLESALVQKAPLDTTDPEFEAFMLVSESGEFTSAALAEAGEPFLLTDNFVYYNRWDSAPEAEQGLWRAAVAADGGFEAPLSLAGDPGVLAAVDGEQVAVHGASALYAISDVDAAASVIELAALDNRNDAGDACESYGLALAGGEVITTLYHQASNESVIFKVALP
jgi:hypothetical protein